MAKIALIGGYYVAPSLIANAQRCLNLYPERNPEDSPFPFTFYQTPGLISKCTLIPNKPVRCLYRASTGDLYGVCGPNVYYIDASWTATVLGTIDDGTSIVSMADDRLVITIVDGTSKGYYIDLTNNRAFGQIVADAFYGATKCGYIDTFMAFNRPATNQFYISASELSASLVNGGAVTAGTIVGGFSYSNGTHVGVPLSGGSGSGALASVTVTFNAVSGVTITAGGGVYQVGDVLSADALALGGAILAQSLVSGTGYTTPGTYTGVSLVGGSGTGATATMVVGSGVVLSATIANRGQDYRVGDILTANTADLGGAGSGFEVLVSSVASSGSGFSYTVTAVNTGTGAFDALDVAAKSGASDSLVSFGVIHDEIWLLGALTTEVWNDTGAPDFAFGKIPGIFVQQGCVAPYSVAQTDLSLFWLSQNPEGGKIVLMGTPYKATRVSTHAIENALNKYSRVDDAIGFTYQQDGHSFYILTFPTADRTWCYDLATELWHERCWIDDNGDEHRIRGQVSAYAYGVNLVGDWENGTIYELDLNTYTDDGQPIVRRRGFPHLVNEGKRVCYDQFIAEMEVGSASGMTDELLEYGFAVDGSGDGMQVNPGGDGWLVYSSKGVMGPYISLRYSDTKGNSWGNPIELSLGATGEYSRSVQARQLGMGRDRVFELFWSGNFKTALNGAYIEVTPAET